MSHALPPDPPSANRLLAALPRAEYLRFLPHLERISFTYRQSLYDANTSIPYVWFIERGVASVIRVMKDGAMIEISVIGSEGLVGLPVFLGAESTPSQAFVQIASHCA